MPIATYSIAFSRECTQKAINMRVRIAPAIKGTVEFSVSQDVMVSGEYLCGVGERDQFSRCLAKNIRE
jgi:hypothetical protein